MRATLEFFYRLPMWQCEAIEPLRAIPSKRFETFGASPPPVCSRGSTGVMPFECPCSHVGLHAHRRRLSILVCISTIGWYGFGAHLLRETCACNGQRDPFRPHRYHTPPCLSPTGYSTIPATQGVSAQTTRTIDRPPLSGWTKAQLVVDQPRKFGVNMIRLHPFLGRFLVSTRRWAIGPRLHPCSLA